jgi:hypothetical protein
LHRIGKETAVYRRSNNSENNTNHRIHKKENKNKETNLKRVLKRA